MTHPRAWPLGLLLCCGLNAGLHAAEPPPLALRSARQVNLEVLGVSTQLGHLRSGLLQAMQAHPEVLSAKAAADSKAIELEAAQYARYPRFQLGTGAGSSSSQGDGGSESYRVVSATARMTLLDGGVISSRIDATQANSVAFEMAMKSTSQKVALDALTAYMQVLRFENKRTVAQSAVAALDELSRLEQRKVDLGAVGENDLRMTRSRRAAFAAKRQEFEVQLADATAKFESYFGFAPQPSRLPALAIPAQWKPVSQQDLLARVEAQSTELAEARSRIEHAQALVRQQEAARFPAVEVVVAKTRDPRGVVYADSTRTGLEFNWNFGNGFDLQLKVKTALAELANQEARLEAVRLQLAQLSNTAWGQAQAGEQKVSELAGAVREAALLVQGRRRMLEVGRETLLQVLDAQVEHDLQLLDFVDAVADLRTNELRLARVSGRLALDAASDAGWVGQLFAQGGSSGLLWLAQGRCPVTAGCPVPEAPQGGVAVAALRLHLERELAAR